MDFVMKTCIELYLLSRDEAVRMSFDNSAKFNFLHLLLVRFEWEYSTDNEARLK